jgi:hypothetical protein
MLKVLKYIMVAALLLLAIAWISIKFYGDAPTLISESKAETNKGVAFDSTQFENGKIQAVIQEEFMLNTSKTGKITISVESIASEDYLHQKFEIKFSGLMLKGMIGNQSFGMITNIKDSLRYSYDLKKKEYTKNTFAEIREKAAQKKDSTSSKKDKRKFNLFGNTDDDEDDSKTTHTQVNDLINGKQAIKITSKSTNKENKATTITHWYSPDIIAKTKNDEMSQKVSKYLGNAPQMADIVNQIQAVILKSANKNNDNQIDENHTLFKLILESDDEDLGLQTEYELLNHYFINFNKTDFSVPEKCKIKN